MLTITQLAFFLTVAASIAMSAPAAHQSLSARDFERRAPSGASSTTDHKKAMDKHFKKEMERQNKMQQQTMEEQFAHKMNDAAWKVAHHAAKDKIQRRRRDLVEDDFDFDLVARRRPSAAQFAKEMKAQNAMQQQTTQEEFAQKMNDAAWRTAQHAAKGKIQRRGRDLDEDYENDFAQRGTEDIGSLYELD